MTKRLKTVPEFANEADERRFWEQHDSSDYLNWTQARQGTTTNDPQHRRAGYGFASALSKPGDYDCPR